MTGPSEGGADPAAGPAVADERASATTGDRAVEESVPSFPPDATLDLPGGLSFVRALLAVALVGALADLACVGLDGGPCGRLATGSIPYSYHFFVGVVYLVAAVPLVRRVHGIFAAVLGNLVELAGRPRPVGGRERDDPTPEAIHAAMTRALHRWFHPAVLLGGAVASGVFGLGVMYLLGVLRHYPHLLTDFTYAAAHGLYFGPLLGGIVLVRRVASEYIVDVDVLAPDGVGGYRAVGDALVSLLSYAAFLVTLDFVVLSSVYFVPDAELSVGLLDDPLGFETVVAALYLGMLLSFVALTVVSVFAVRNRLLALRDDKIDDLRAEFEAVEAAYWRKRRRGEDTRAEAADIRTMRAMFEELNGMSLWPLNLYSVLKLAGTVGLSLFVFGLQQWLVAVV